MNYGQSGGANQGYEDYPGKYSSQYSNTGTKNAGYGQKSDVGGKDASYGQTSDVGGYGQYSETSGKNASTYGKPPDRSGTEMGYGQYSDASGKNQSYGQYASGTGKAPAPSRDESGWVPFKKPNADPANAYSDYGYSSETAGKFSEFGSSGTSGKVPGQSDVGGWKPSFGGTKPLASQQFPGSKTAAADPKQSGDYWKKSDPSQQDQYYGYDENMEVDETWDETGESSWQDTNWNSGYSGQQGYQSTQGNKGPSQLAGGKADRFPLAVGTPSKDPTRMNLVLDLLRVMITMLAKAWVLKVILR